MSPIFLIPYIFGPLLGGFMAAGLSKLATRIYNEEEEEAERDRLTLIHGASASAS